MDFANYWFSSGSGGGDNPIPFPIGSSLRFRGGQYLQRSVPVESNRASWSFSCWMKRAKIGSQSVMFGVSGDSFNIEHLQFSNSDVLNRYIEFGNQKSGYGSDSSKYRDPAGWYHVLWVNDMAASPAANRTRVYLNGEQVTLNYTQAGAPSPAPASLINTVRTHFVGRGAYTGTSYDMYMAEVHFVDGTQLLPTDFGEENEHGVWVPKQVTGLAYGTNGFYLDFSDPADIGADRSGNGNHYTPTNFELTNTTSTSYDWMADSPTNNYQTLNPLTRNYSRLTKANRSFTGGAPSTSKISYSSTFKLPRGGRWYAEWAYDVRNSDTDAGLWVGVCSDDFNPNTSTTARYERAYRLDNGNKLTRTAGSASESSFGASCTAGDRIGVAVDMDNGRIWFAKNNVWQASGDPGTGANPAFSDLLTNTYDQLRLHASVRNREATFWNGGSSGFTYTPPTGFSALCTAELPDVAITNPSEHFTTILDTGANILTNAQATFPNGLWWIKDRANSNQHQLVDSVTNAGNTIVLNSPDRTKRGPYTTPSGNSVAWCWNYDSANPAANGFEICTWTGDGTNDRVIPHNLGKAPEFMIISAAATGNDAYAMIYHVGLDASAPQNYTMNLNTSGSRGTTTRWNNTAPTSTGFTVGQTADAANNPNRNNRAHVGYVWTSVPGYSAFGRMTGAGSSDGAFVYTGFRPALVIIKNESTNDWMIMDSSRDAYNPSQTFLHSNSTQKEYSSYGALLDFVSNGFKIRSNNDRVGSTNTPYIWCAWAEYPFGGGNVAPSPAR